MALTTQLYHMVITCWILLEMLTWALFFLFFLNYNKVLMNLLFLFFIIQTSCRFIWLLRTLISQIRYEVNFLVNIIIGLSLIIKIGLFPGYIWRLNIYNSANMPVALALSSIAKFLPLILLLVWFVNGSINRSSQAGVLFCLFFSYLRVIINMWERRNLFSFIFYSGIFHVSNIILILIINSVTIFFLYFLAYVLTLLSFATICQHYNIKNLQGHWKYINIDFFLIVHLIRVVGFPPFPLFWFKLLILYKLWTGRFFIRISTFSILIVIFVYLIISFYY